MKKRTGLILWAILDAMMFVVAFTLTVIKGVMLIAAIPVVVVISIVGAIFKVAIDKAVKKGEAK